MPSMSSLDVYPKEVLRKLASGPTSCCYLWELELEKSYIKMQCMPAFEIYAAIRNK